MSIINNSTKPLIAVDFDGTLCNSNYPACGPVIPGGKEALQRFRDLGFLILIYSCRSCHWHYDIFGGSRDVPVMERTTVTDMRAVLVENEIPFDEIDDGSMGKPYADYYIDDKGVRFQNNWAEITKFIESRTV